MQQTKIYKLNKPEKTDVFSPDPLNENMDKLEAALLAEDKDHAAIRGELAAALKTIGTSGHTCRVVHGSYIGDGTSGVEHPTRLEPGFCPVLVFLSRPDGNMNNYPVILARGVTQVKMDSLISFVVWGDRKVEYYSGNGASHQLNAKGFVYDYTIFGFED